MIRNSRTFEVLLTTCLMSSKDRFTCPPILHVSTGLIRNFCIANNTLCLHFALFFCNHFFPISPGCYSRCTQIEVLAYAKFWVHYVYFLIINRTAKEHEWSDPRKWEKNQGQTRTFDSRSGRGSKPRKRYVLNFLIKRTRSHLVSTLQKLCHIPAFAICKTVLYQATFSLCRSAGRSLFSAWDIPNCWYFFLARSTLSFPFYFSFCHLTNRCPFYLWRGKLTQGLSPVATKSQHCN